MPHAGIVQKLEAAFHAGGQVQGVGRRDQRDLFLGVQFQHQPGASGQGARHRRALAFAATQDAGGSSLAFSCSRTAGGFGTKAAVNRLLFGDNLNWLRVQEIVGMLF